MADMHDWRKDAMVRLEKRLYPLSARLLRQQFTDPPEDLTLVVDLRESARALRNGQARYFDTYSIELGKPELAALAEMAAWLDRLARRIDEGRPPFEGPDLGASFAEALEYLLDTLREAFLSQILSRQAEAQRVLDSATRNIAAISRQIYFISINATVEAARVGEAGKGFGVISAQIRTLAEETAGALRKLGVKGAR